VVLSPGLFPVVHLTSVSEASVTKQGIPSIMMVLSSTTEEKPVPVNVTGVPPTTVPNLGVIAVSFGVKVLTNLTFLSRVYDYPYVIRFTSHSCKGV